MKLVITLETESGAVHVEGLPPQILPQRSETRAARNHEPDVQERLHALLNDRRWTWRTLRTLAIEGSFLTEDETAAILSSMDDVRQANDAPHLWGLRSRND